MNIKKVLKSFVISAIMGIMILSSVVVFADTTSSEYKNVIPDMTSNTSPSGIASSSSDLNNDVDNYGAWRAFRIGNTNDYGWTSNSQIAQPSYLMYDFGIGKKICQYTITPGSPFGDNIGPISWTFEGSNGSDGWTVLDTRSNITNWVAGTAVAFTVTNDKDYTEYRINISNTGYSNYLGRIASIKHMEMMEKVDSVILATSISLNKVSLTLPVQQSEILTATITPVTATNQSVTWTSSDTTIATVDSTGKVTAGNKAGTATITATTTDGSNLSAPCVVTVTDSNTTTPTNPTDGTSTIVNIAHAKGDNTNNAGGEVSIIFNGVSDATLSVVKTADVKSVWVGDTFTYTIVVKNTGSKTAKAVVINDSAPNHIQFMPSGITTTQGKVDSSSTSSNIVVNVGDIPPSGTVTITVPATVAF